MILSDAEIRNALELTRPGRRPALPTDRARPADPAAPKDNSAQAHPMAPDPDLRLARVQGLRAELCAGTYDPEPDSVAAKMIGRAIADRIAQLIDGAEDTDD